MKKFLFSRKNIFEESFWTKKKRKTNFETKMIMTMVNFILFNRKNKNHQKN